MITTIYSRDLYTGDGSDDTFAISFDFQSNNDNVKVSVTDASGILQVQTYTTHYTIVSTNVVFVSPPALNRKIVIELSPTQTQDTDFPENSVAQASIYEATLDRITLIVQWLKATVSRIIAFSEIAENEDDFGTMSSQNSNDVDITGGSITGLTIPLLIADGGTSSTTASTARTALGYGTIAVRDTNTANVTGGTIAGIVPNINGLTADGSPDSTTDYVLTYDDSGSVNKKVLLGNVISASTDLVTDLNPTLSGDLDLNTFSIVSPSVTLSDVLDQDNMSGDSATKSITQQSAKAYVDNAVIHANRVVISAGGTVYYPGATTYGYIGTSSIAGDPPNSGNSLIIPITGTIRNLFFKTDEVVPIGEYLIITINVNGIATAITCNVIAGNSSASDTTNIESVVAGDLVSIQIIASGGVAGGNLTQYSIELRY